MGQRNMIAAYGNETDRKKLTVLSTQQGKSSSKYIIEMIRREYYENFGAVHPDDYIHPEPPVE